MTMAATLLAPFQFDFMINALVISALVAMPVVWVLPRRTLPTPA